MKLRKIIAIGGPTGVGKTDTGWASLEKLYKNRVSCTLMDADWYANSRPFSWDNAHDLISVFSQMQGLIKHHWENGRDVIIIPHCYQVSLNITRMEKIAKQTGAAFIPVALKCETNQPGHRITGPDRIPEQQEQEQKDARHHQAEPDKLENWLVIDNTHLSESQTAEIIIEALNQSG